jgi:hypothetical protein
MQDERAKRSADRDIAMTHLLDAFSKAHSGVGVAVLDEAGRMLAGSGSPREMWAAARQAQRGAASPGEGFVSVPVAGAPEPMRLVAFRMREGSAMSRVADGVSRISRTLSV